MSAGGPLSRVSAAMRAGTTGRRGIAEATGLDLAMVDAALDQLDRLGMIAREELGSACPTDGCGGCSSSGSCGAKAPGRGPVMLTLRTRRPGA